MAYFSGTLNATETWLLHFALQHVSAQSAVHQACSPDDSESTDDRIIRNLPFRGRTGNGGFVPFFAVPRSRHVAYGERTSLHE